MKYLGNTVDHYSKIGARYTSMEIFKQPEIWGLTLKKLHAELPELERFMIKAINESGKIILTGAGTSAFIGNSLEGKFFKNTGKSAIAIPSTHLVTHPDDYLDKNTPTLIISFARSGNSPESTAVLMVAEQTTENCIFLNITCNKNGGLANYKTRGRLYNLILPEECNDQSLAMTSSYTSMLLAGLIVSNIKNYSQSVELVSTIINYAHNILNNHYHTIRDISKLNFTRAVFLGSGPLFGTATESHLKLQELTDGKIICKSDSYLAFRHGPKAVIDKNTLVVYLLSNNKYVQQYEKDFINSLSKQSVALHQLLISEDPHPELNVDTRIVMNNNGQASKLDESYLAVSTIIPAQLLALFKSIQLGITPDNPSANGLITRVVKGVTIYPYKIK